MKYSSLLSPGKIGSLEVKNRIMLAAMGSNFAEEDGSCGERIQAYYEERARGGAGLLVLETSAVAWPAGATMPRMVGFSDERFLPGRVPCTPRRINGQLRSSRLPAQPIRRGHPA